MSWEPNFWLDRSGIDLARKAIEQAEQITRLQTAVMHFAGYEYLPPKEDREAIINEANLKEGDLG
jgi:hypothetical protein